MAAMNYYDDVLRFEAMSGEHAFYNLTGREVVLVDGKTGDEVVLGVHYKSGTYGATTQRARVRVSCAADACCAHSVSWPSELPRGTKCVLVNEQIRTTLEGMCAECCAASRDALDKACPGVRVYTEGRGGYAVVLNCCECHTIAPDGSHRWTSELCSECCHLYDKDGNVFDMSDARVAGTCELWLVRFDAGTAARSLAHK